MVKLRLTELGNKVRTQIYFITVMEWTDMTGVIFNIEIRLGRYVDGAVLLALLETQGL